MSRTRTGNESSIVLENISWNTYERLLREVGERHIRLTYDNGDLEIMTLSFGHENRKGFIRRLIEMLTFELEIPVRSGGSTTMRKKLKKKGLEPDECYWIANEKLMRDKEEFEPNADPPPGLALEIDVTSSSLDRMGIYAALKVPEVWRYRRRRLNIHLLNNEGSFEEADQSRIFPFLPVSELDRFIRQSETEDETAVLRDFVRWVKGEVLPRFQAHRQETKGNGKRKKE